ncbi:unnamed protein product, partial [Rotaria sp. Silwood1]
ALKHGDFNLKSITHEAIHNDI